MRKIHQTTRCLGMLILAWMTFMPSNGVSMDVAREEQGAQAAQVSYLETMRTGWQQYQELLRKTPFAVRQTDEGSSLEQLDALFAQIRATKECYLSNPPKPISYKEEHVNILTDLVCNTIGRAKLPSTKVKEEEATFKAEKSAIFQSQVEKLNARHLRQHTILLEGIQNFEAALAKRFVESCDHEAIHLSHEVTSVVSDIPSSASYDLAAQCHRHVQEIETANQRILETQLRFVRTEPSPFEVPHQTLKTLEALKQEVSEPVKALANLYGEVTAFLEKNGGVPYMFENAMSNPLLDELI